MKAAQLSPIYWLISARSNWTAAARSSGEEADTNMLGVATVACSGKGKENEPRHAAVPKARRGILLSQEIQGQVLEVRFFKTVDQEDVCSLAITA